MTIEGTTTEERWRERLRRPAGRAVPVRLALRWVPAALLGGAATGVLVHLVDTAPQALAAGGGILRMVMSVGLVVAILLAALRALLMDDPALVVAIPSFALAAILVYPLAPTWVPGATTAGTYRLELRDHPEGSMAGALACAWRPGNYRMGDLEAATPVVLPDGERVVLHASFTDRAVWLERVAPDGTARAPYADRRFEVLEPPRDETLAPRRTVDGRSGTAPVTLLPDLTRPPAGAGTRWDVPLAVDPVGAVDATLAWDCPAP